MVTIFTFPILFSEIDNEGVVEPDTDEPQPMGDMNVEVCITADLCKFIR